MDVTRHPSGAGRRMASGRSGAPGARAATSTLRWFVAAIVVLALLPNAASAHVKLVSSSPADGGALTATPRHVVLTFSTDVAGKLQKVQALTATGDDVAGDARVAGSTVTVPVADGTTGAIRVSWRVLGPDGHPIKGEFQFTVRDGKSGSHGAAHGQSGAPGGYPTAAIGAVGAVARLLFYVTLLMVAGGGIFATLVARRWRPRGYRPACVVLVAAAITMFFGNLALAGEYSLAALLNPWNFLPHVTTPVGRVTIACAAIAAFLLLVGYRRLERGGARDRQLFAGMSILLAAIPAFGGHAIASQAPWLRVPADVLHLVAASVWFGGIVQLQRVASVSYAAHPAVYPTVRRYARFAFASVLVLVVTGTVAALLEIGLDAGDLFGTSYGRLVLLKVGLLALTLPLAKANQDRHVPALIDGSRRSSANLRRYVVFEVLLVASIIAVTSWLVYETPPRHAGMGHDVHGSS